MDASARGAVPLALGADRAAHRRLCRAAVLRLALGARCKGPPPEHGRADLARHSAGDRHEPLQTMLGSEQVYFDAAVIAPVLPAGRPLPRRVVARARPRGEAQNLLSLQGGIATLIDAGRPRRMVPAHALRPATALLVAAGERVAADGVVTSGPGEIDQSLITGETAPRAVAPGDRSLPARSTSPSRSQIEVTAADSGDAARRDRPADAGGRAAAGALSQARRPRGADLRARRARPRRSRPSSAG